MATKKTTTKSPTTTTDKYRYKKLDEYLEKHEPDECCPITLANMAARAGTSQDSGMFELYSQAALDALKKTLDERNIICDVNIMDVMGMATCSPQVKKEFWDAPVDVYIKRLFDVGRASKPKAKAKAKSEAKVDPIDALIEQTGGVEALLKALLEKVK